MAKLNTVKPNYVKPNTVRITQPTETEIKLEELEKSILELESEIKDLKGKIEFLLHDVDFYKKMADIGLEGLKASLRFGTETE